ncbi:MAG: 2-amino-4-hydroxy-6-hydroxymethyldihydropteridine diphosphokinase [Candidatus Aminicenantes bacterium]|nr:2-amino-4-hydroxy-6-hydroxymethyldihydropteridine diphosphokinase [Candidatus Aminicenantes bacterium]
MPSFACSNGSTPSASDRRRYYIGLGGNIGDCRRTFSAAAGLLVKGGVRIRKTSSLYRAEPVGPRDQPWFWNAVLAVESPLAPREMLQLAKAIEFGLGRKPGLRHGPRPLDIDILLAGRTVLRSAGLEIPHPRLAERRFVLVPLAEIAPRAVHPVRRKTILSLLRETGDRSSVIRMRSAGAFLSSLSRNVPSFTSKK